MGATSRSNCVLVISAMPYTPSLAPSWRNTQSVGPRTWTDWNARLAGVNHSSVNDHEMLSGGSHPPFLPTTQMLPFQNVITHLVDCGGIAHSDRR